MSFRSLLAAATTTVTLALGLVLVGTTTASAHDVLASTAPTADSSVSGDLDEVSLTFSEPPLAGLESGIVVSVTDPAGTEVSGGDVDVDGATLRTTADLSTAGAYTVTWRSVSVDGHPISGSYRFTSTGATTTPTPTPSPSSAPTASSETLSATRTPSPSAAAPSGSDLGPLPWVLGGVGVLVAAGLVLALVLVRRTSRTTD